MNQTPLPPLSFFLEKVINLDNLVPALVAYLELLEQRIKLISTYENPMLFIKEVDHYEQIFHFTQILIDERQRIKNAKDESAGDTRPDADKEG